MSGVLVARGATISKFPGISANSAARIRELNSKAAVGPSEICSRPFEHGHIHAVHGITGPYSIDLVIDRMGSQTSVGGVEEPILSVHDTVSAPGATCIGCREHSGILVQAEGSGAIDRCIGDPINADHHGVLDPAAIVRELVHDLMKATPCTVRMEDSFASVYDTGAVPSVVGSVHSRQGVRTVQYAIGSCAIDGTIW